MVSRGVFNISSILLEVHQIVISIQLKGISSSKTTSLQKYQRNLARRFMNLGSIMTTVTSDEGNSLMNLAILGILVTSSISSGILICHESQSFALDSISQMKTESGDLQLITLKVSAFVSLSALSMRSLHPLNLFRSSSAGCDGLFICDGLRMSIFCILLN